MICPTCRADNIEGVDNCVNCGHDLQGFDQPGAPGGTERGPEFIYLALRELAPKTPSFVNHRDPVGLAVRLMQNEETDCLLAMDGDRLVGIITPADILHKVAGPNEDLNAVTIGQVITADPVCLNEDDDLAVAINKLAVGGFRHIPILRGGVPVAVANVWDLFRYLAPHLV